MASLIPTGLTNAPLSSPLESRYFILSWCSWVLCLQNHNHHFLIVLIKTNSYSVLILMLTLVRPYGAQQPQLLARYPLTDHKVTNVTVTINNIITNITITITNNFIKEFPLPRDMVYFCQPDGTTSTSRFMTS